MKYHFFTVLLLMTLTRSNLSAQVPAQALPNFTFFKLNQSSFTNNNLPTAKMLFFIFFDSDCDHCQRTINNIDKNYDSFKKASMFLVSMDSREKIDNFMTKYAMTLKAQKNVVLLQDSLKQFITKFNPRKYPSMFLYSSDKKLIDYEDSEEMLFKFINAINVKGK